MGEYLLQPYVHVYSNANLAILLDLRHDSYIGLDRRQVRALSGLVRGWPQHDTAQSPSAMERAFADQLVGKQLLTRDEGQGKETSPLILPTVTDPLVDKYSDISSNITIGDAIRFLRAFLFVRISMACVSMERIVRRIEHRRPSQHLDQPPEDRLRQITVMFHYLRPFFYTAHERCLFDSLVLIEFLAQYRAFPTWVIGVQAEPFCAHSWVQYGKFALNGDPGFIRRYSPILAI